MCPTPVCMMKVRAVVPPLVPEPYTSSASACGVIGVMVNATFENCWVVFRSLTTISDLPSLCCPVSTSLELHLRWVEVFVSLGSIGLEGPGGDRVWRLGQASSISSIHVEQNADFLDGTGSRFRILRSVCPFNSLEGEVGSLELAGRTLTLTGAAGGAAQIHVAAQAGTRLW